MVSHTTLHTPGCACVPVLIYMMDRPAALCEGKVCIADPRDATWCNDRVLQEFKTDLANQVLRYFPFLQIECAVAERMIHTAHYRHVYTVEHTHCIN